MLATGKTESTRLDKAKRRLIKFLGLGKKDVKEILECAPYGLDSNPVKDTVAVYGRIGTNGSSVLIGYLNTNQKAATGEFRIYSTDSQGNEKIYLWLKADGTMELGGTADNAVRYSKLDTSLQNFKNLLTAELTKIATGIAGAGGSYTPGALTIDTTPAKINEIKTP